MSVEQPTPDTATVDAGTIPASPQPDIIPEQPAPPPSTPPQPARGNRWTLWLVALAFIAGIAATVWGPGKFRQLWSGDSASEAVSSQESAPQTLQSAPVTARTVDDLEARLASLGTRMESLAVQAQNASAYAARAEAIMVAVAARRALDNGQPLGYLENELRVRFADAQPRAVSTIITAAREPVTLADLQAGLADLSPSLTGMAPSGSWWESVHRELANLIIIRKAGSPSPVPQKALTQARTLLDAGRVEAALVNVETIPNNGRASGWIQMARRYNEARRALDVIEAAAILEPRAVPVMAAEAKVVDQPGDDAANASVNMTATN